MAKIDDRTIIEAAAATLAARQGEPSLLSRVMSIGAGLAAAGRLSRQVIDEAAGHYALCLIRKQGEDIRELSGECQLVVGRKPEAQGPVWEIDDNWLSREHFRITIDADGFANLEDMASKNGVWVNDIPLAGSRLLARGDCIRAGESTFLLL